MEVAVPWDLAVAVTCEVAVRVEAMWEMAVAVI